MENNDKIVAFIDLLAFSNNVRKNTGDAMMAFSNYNAILQTKIRDGIAHPIDSYPKELQELAKNKAIDSINIVVTDYVQRHLMGIKTLVKLTGSGFLEQLLII